jgi:ureidoacrylate peracid hydrolase
MLPRLQHLLSAARAASVTPIFLRYAQTESTQSEVHLEQRARGRADLPYCQEGTVGADFYAVAPLPNEVVVTKHRYSGFIGTDLDVVLRSRRIRTLVMTGIATNGCVEATARDGFMHDYYIVFTADCSASYSEELHQGTLTNIADAYGVVVNSAELVGLWHEDGRQTAGPAGFRRGQSLRGATK